MRGGVLVDEPRFVLEVRVQLAGAHEGRQPEVVVQHHLADEVVVAVAVLGLVADGGRTRNAAGQLVLRVRAALRHAKLLIYDNIELMRRERGHAASLPADSFGVLS